MATHRISILGSERPDTTVPLDRVGAQTTEATTPSMGDNICYVLADGGADEGLYLQFKMPKNYVGSPAIVVTGILDGAPGASDVLAFGFRKRAIANNESADGTFDAEQTVSETIGSGGTSHSDEDLYEKALSLTAGDYAVDDQVLSYFYIDASVNTYAGNFLLLDLELQYTDV